MNNEVFSKQNGLELTAERFLAVFPVAMSGDQIIAALAKMAAAALEKRAAETGLPRIYPNLMSLPEDLLDILAYDFKVDWWNPDYTLEEKRRVLRDSWYVHRLMGTRAAVETALKAVYRDATILEWFEYGGEPGYFRLWTDVTNEDFVPALRREILRRMDFYKRLSAHLESAGYYMKAEPARAWAYIAHGGEMQKRWGEIKPPPSVGPPETGTVVIYGGVLAGMAGSADRAAVIPPAVKPPECKPSLVEACFLYAGQIQKRWNGMVSPPDVGPPKVEVKAAYGSVLAGMAGSTERTGKVPPEVGTPVCRPSNAAVWACHTDIKGRSRAEVDLPVRTPEAGITVGYGCVAAGVAGSLRITKPGVKLEI